MRVATIGLDLGKQVFQVHGVGQDGRAVVRKRLRRSEVLAFFRGVEPCLMGLEACATAHHWARELSRLGHEVRLMPPAYGKPYVKRGKNDAADAEATCEAVTRPCDGGRSTTVSLGPAVRRLDRAGASAELQWRQGAAGRHCQAGRPLPA